MKIDRIDRKIIMVLDLNARLSINQIAKKVGTSRDVVDYRIKKLEKEGVITKYICHTQNHIFGIENYLIKIKLQNHTSSIEKRIINKIEKIPYVKLLLNLRGEYDLQILLGAKNKIHLAESIDMISNYCSKNLKELDVLIPISTFQTREMSFLLSDFNPESKSLKPKNQEIDLLDKKIIKELSNNAKKPVYKIAQKVKSSSETVSRRIKQLIKNKIITNTKAIININKLGYEQYQVLIKFSHYNRTKHNQIKQLIKQNKNIIHAIRVIGKYDLELSVACSGQQELCDNIESFKNYFKNDLSEYSSCLVKEQIKRISFVGKI